jgi:hypothetical protein
VIERKTCLDTLAVSMLAFCCLLWGAGKPQGLSSTRGHGSD